MKKIYFTILLLLIFSGTALSQTGVWTEQNSGVTVTLTSASELGGVWVCGYSGTVLHSSTKGLSWVNVSGNGIPPNIQLINIVSVGSTSALVSGYIGSNTFVYRTFNDGASWVQVFTEANGFINAITVQDNNPNNGFMMGDPVGGRWSLWKTTNAGVTWDSAGCYLPRSGTTEAGWNNSLFGIDQKLWFGTNNSKIYYSSNYGSNWIAQPTTGEVNTYALWFEKYTPQNGWCAGSSMRNTTNYGSSWNSISTLGAGNFGGINGGPYIITNNQMAVPYIFYVRSDNKIYTSTNNGVNWFIQYTAPAGNYRYIGTNIPAGSFWAVRDNGGISHIDVVTKVVQTGTEVPDKFSLSQNYPNPFNPVTRIQFHIPSDVKRQTSDVKLIIYNALGKEVETLVNEKLSAGSYEVEFDARDARQGSNFSSGVYFYKLVTESFIQTKSMILLK